jgi:hypothetical protein
MSRSELERLVDEAESDAVIRRAIQRSRSRHELVLAARRLGYAISRADLRDAMAEHRSENASHEREQRA